MNQFIAFVRKEFHHIFRDKRTMLILLAMPVVQILLFGFAITTEVKDTRVAVFDPSQDACTRLVKEHFQASKYFTLSQEITNPQDIDNVFKRGEAGLVLVFSEKFADNLRRSGEASVQVITDGTEPNQAGMIANYAAGVLADCRQELAGSGVKGAAAIVPQLHMLYNPQSESAYNFVPGVMGLVLMLVCAMMTAIAVVREKETGTMEILLASPLRPICIILAKATPYFVFSAVNLASILLLSRFVLGVPIAGNLWLLLAVSLIFIFLALSLGLLISNIVSSQMAAMLASGMGLMIPVIILSGLMFPIESMPRVLLWLSAVVPARWYIEAVKKIMIQGVPLQYVVKEMMILAVMAVVLVTVSLKLFKTRLK